jgi:hypothetical protein
MNCGKRIRHCLTLLAVLVIPAAVLLVPAGFGSAGAETLSGTEYAFIVTTDYYSAAYYSTIEILPPRVTDVSISTVNTDAVAYYDLDEDMVFVVNRFLADNIQLVDPRAGFATVGQYSVGNGSNPHDIRLAGNGKAYITRFEWKTLLICDAYTGDSLGTVDLSPLADSDGIPEMDRMEIAEGRLFITMNNIDHATWQPVGPGKVAVVDIAADTLVDADSSTPGVQPITLTLTNPYTELRYDPCRGELYVGCLGTRDVPDGGIEAIDPAAMETKGVITTGTLLGGDISDCLLSPGPKGYAVVMDSAGWPQNFGRLVSFDTATGAVMDTLYMQTTGSGAALAGIEFNRQGEIYLCDRDAFSPGIRIYDFVADTLIAFVDVGVPPYDIAFVQEAHAGVQPLPVPGAGSAPIVLRAYPNPATSAANIVFELPSGPAVPVEIGIYDAAGRLVRNVEAGLCRPGIHRVLWDGTEGGGRSAAAGVYYCSLKGAAGNRALPLVLIR